MTDSPAFVTVFIPMLNEESFIGRCLDSVVGFDYPKQALEVLVFDGGSTDKSRDVVAARSREHAWIHLLDNPLRTQANGFNAALNRARGRYFVRLDAHSEYAADYITRCVDLLQRTGAVCVGGRQRPTGSSYASKAIAMAYTSRFAAGNAAFRYSDREQWTDTVYLGAYVTDALRTVGGMDTSWVVNEDYELNYRLRQQGGRILLSPSIASEYWVRSSMGALARQYFRYGMWRARTALVHPGSLRWRQLAAPSLVVGLLFAGALSARFPAFLVIPAVYLTTVVVVSATIASRRGAWRYFPPMSLTFVIIHVCWGIGFLTGLARFAFPSQRKTARSGSAQ